MPQSSPRVSLPYLQPSQAQKHITHNEALQRLDAVTQLTLQGVAEVTPPTLPAAGDMYGVGSGATGVWAGQDGLLAYWDGTGWLFLSPQEGWRAWGMSEQALFVWRTGGWQALLDGIETLGINTGADLINRLSVAATASLFSHAGAGHQLKINKAADTETASLLFQSNWTGHAEMGLAGDTAFVLKISANGTSWDTVLQADPIAQNITLAPAGTARMVLGDAGLSLDVPVTGTAVQSDATDTTAGRLLTVGAFGLGATGHVTNLGDWDATDMPGGLYLFSVSTANLASKPAEYVDGNFGLVRIERYSASYFTQTCWCASGDAKRYMRRYQAGSWTRWTPLHDEYGENGTGKYLRLADGTQVVWGYITPDFTSAANQSFAFPAAFVSGDPAGGITSIRSGSATAVANFKTVEASGGASPTNIFLKLDGAGVNGTGSEYQLTYLYFGRWV